MKKIAYILPLLLLLAGCRKDIIELTPISTVSTDALYKTDKDFQDAVIGVYQPFQAQYQNFWQFGDLPGDDVEQQHSASLDLVNINNFIINSNTAVLNTSWLNYYQIIFRANTVLANLETVNTTTVPNKDRHTGEAKFLRALAYFDLVRIFGDVPLITSPITAQDALKKGRDKVDVIYSDLITKDLMDAEIKLPVKYTGTDVGRATRGAAKALLGKAYLTHKEFAKAEAKLQEVTTLGYALLPNYADLFDYSKDEHHSEYIFDIEYVDGGLGLGSTFTNAFAPNLAPILNLYGIKGTGGQNASPTDVILNLFEPTDIRKAVTVTRVADGLIDKNGNKISLIPIDVTTYSKKYLTSIPNANDSKANWKVIRYADVLLMYAEALNENGKSAEALPYLNQIRTRAGVARYGTLSQADLRDKIFLERRFEFTLEGQRWFDLVRSGQAVMVLQKQGLKPFMTLFPIPLAQVQVVNNPSIFPQNPGYN